MSPGIDLLLRSPNSYDLAARALAEMRRCKVWPTPLNFELWIQIIAEPSGALATEVGRLIAAGEAITEAKSAELAAVHLAHHITGDNLSAASAKLAQQIDTIGRTLAQAQREHADYGRTLAGATEVFAKADPPVLAEMLNTLTVATRLVQSQSSALERRLHDSTSEVERLQQRLDVVRRDAMTDALTGLANRKAWDEGIDKAVAEAARGGQPLSVAILDIDHFKRFNDTWGHQTGDQVIRYVASVIDRIGKPPRLAARYGGEEYAIALPGDTAEVTATLLDTVRLEIGSRRLKRRSTNEDLGAVTVSIGVAQYRLGESATALVGRADVALYASKHGGRNLVTNGEACLQSVA
jgi:diguanylate cyclase